MTAGIRPTLLACALAFIPWSACQRASSPGQADPLADATATPPPSGASQSLPVTGETLEQTIASDGRHAYRVNLDVGTFLQVSVEQHDTDIELSVEDPNGATVLIADGPTAGHGREIVAIVAQESGPHHIGVRAFTRATPGRYSLRVDAQTVATPDHRTRAQASSDLAQGESFADRGNLDEAVVHYREALAAWRTMSDRWGVATVLHRLALAEHRRHQFDLAVEAATEAATLFQALDQPALAAMALHATGRAHFAAGDLQQAVAAYEKALPLRARGGDTHGEAITATNLGLAHRYLAQPRQAQRAYRHALALLESLDEPHATATVLHNLGTLHRTLGEHERARDRLGDALRIRRTLGDATRTAATLDQLGRVAETVGDDATALRRFEQGLVLATEADDPFGRAVIETRLGRLRQRQGDPAQARDAFERALPIMRDHNDSRSEAQILQLLGTLEIDLGRPRIALAHLRDARTMHNRHGELTSVAETALAIARAEQQQGRLDQAWSALREARVIVESVRGEALLDVRRAKYAATATVRDLDTLEIDLAMERHARDPGAGWDAHALTASERARARWLLDLVAETGAELRSGIDPALLATEDDALAALTDATRRREALREEGAPTILIRAADRRFRDDLETLTLIRETIRTQRLAARTNDQGRLGRPRPRTTDELREKLLDPDTVLVEMAFGEHKSYLWVLRHDRLFSFDLPPRAEIESLARRTLALLRHAHHREGRATSQAALCQVSALILAPAAEVLVGDRLLVVTSGALQTLPFASLPHPARLDGCGAAPPLIDSHEVIHLPSASVATMLRQRRSTRAPASRAVAVIADPVTSPDDPRLPSRLIASGYPPPTHQATHFRRLPRAHQETEAIRRLALDGGAPLITLGFDANRDFIRKGHLSDYRLIHFATHAVLDPEQSVSGLLLSTFGPNGRSIDGWLRPHEIYTLDLNASLVVLSACQTGMGDVLPGEGLIGLTYGFFHAGASQLLVSLWPVDDHATALLMESFYQALLVDQRSASAALRHAQRALRDQAQWSSPYHWAGFVLQGDSDRSSRY